MRERMFEARLIDNKGGEDELEFRATLPILEIPHVLGRLTAVACATVVEGNVDLSDLDEAASLTAIFIWQTQFESYFATMEVVGKLLPEDKRHDFYLKCAQGIELFKKRSLANFEATMQNASPTLH